MSELGAAISSFGDRLPSLEYVRRDEIGVAGSNADRIIAGAAIAHDHFKVEAILDRRCELLEAALKQLLFVLRRNDNRDARSIRKVDLDRQRSRAICSPLCH